MIRTSHGPMENRPSIDLKEKEARLLERIETAEERILMLKRQLDDGVLHQARWKELTYRTNARIVALKNELKSLQWVKENKSASTAS